MLNLLRIRAWIMHLFHRQSSPGKPPGTAQAGLNADTAIVQDVSGRHNQPNDGWQPPQRPHPRFYGQPSRCSRASRR